MAIFVWVMVGLAIWHFTVYLPDHFMGGIAGAFLGAIFGSVLGGLLFNGFGLPARENVDLLTFFESVPGTVVGMGLVYFFGLRQERQEREEKATSTGLAG